MIAILVVLIGLFQPNPYDGRRRELENKMKTWQPGPDVAIELAA
jgi:hypothetical protein